MSGRTRASGNKPLTPAQRARRRKAPTEPSPDVDPGTRITVLVVDDDPAQVALLTRFLVLQGMIALSAYSGQQCLEMVGQQAIDIIVLNIVMPGMDGLTVCAALRQSATTRSTPILVLTAKDDTETRLAAMQLGVSEFVAKPTRARNLLARIRALVGRSRKTRRRKQR